MTTKADVAGKTVHFMFKDRVLCGDNMPTDLGLWPRGHVWISDPVDAAKLVNCDGCLAERARRQTAAANERGR